MIFLVLFLTLAQHAPGHNEYQNWSSGKTANCCNNQDCKALEDTSWRDGPNGVEVKIDRDWCPVQQQHFIIKGKSPDWNVAHACIAPWSASGNPCDRLLCFTGKGLF